MKVAHVSRACAWISLVSLLSGAAHAQDFLQAITDGNLDASLRYRFEHVHDDLAPGGVPLDYQLVRDRIADYLHERSWRRAVHQYVQVLIDEAEIHGMDFPQSAAPLLQ